MDGHNIGSEVKKFVGELGRSNPDFSASARVKRAWTLSVDSRVQEHVTAVFVVPNTNASEVVTYVDSSIWATELNMQAELLRLKMNVELNNQASSECNREYVEEQIEKLRFVVSKESYQRKQQRKSTFELLDEQEREFKNIQPVQLNQDELDTLQEAVAQIDDDHCDMKHAYAAAKANLEWQKGYRKIS